MHKSKLQELCKKREWSPPLYAISKQGKDHSPRFEATVTVNGLSFQSRKPERSSKEAQNDAAYIAFLHLSLDPPPPPPADGRGSSGAGVSNASELPLDHKSAEERKMYKSKLQELCQKRAWGLPQYEFTKEGEGHNPSFKATVTVNSLSFQSQTPSRSSKDAQNDAAYRAFLHFSSNPPPANGVGGELPLGHGSAEERKVFKSQLQELCQKRAWRCPEYEIKKEGQDHNPTLKATVTVNGLSFQSQNPARSSKEAQDDAAHLALLHLPFHNPAASDELPLGNGSTEERKIYKSMLQELCQKRAWTLPDYKITKEGPDHCPSFMATVTVNDVSFQSPSPARSLKDAQNDAAHLAFLHFSSYPPPIPAASTDVQHLYKNLLQTFTQKRNLDCPLYSHEFVGPPHARRFTCKVTVNGQTYESKEFFPTQKEAEHAAAKVALTSLSPDGIQEDDITIYKKLLQEAAQKAGDRLPVYTTISREGHPPTFVSTVEIKGEIFTGQEASKKKLAETLAAKVAYTTLKERKPNGNSTCPTTVEGREVHELSTCYLQSSISADQRQDVRSETNMTFSPSLASQKQITENEASNNISNYHLPIPFSQPQMTTDLEINPFSIPFSKLHMMLDSESRNPLSFPFPQPEMSTDLESCDSSSSYNLDPLLDDGSSVPTTDLVTGFSTMLLGETNTSSCNQVKVYPRVLNMMFPTGSTVLPVSDENWVAVKLMPQPLE